MPAVTAERLCPEAIFVPPDFTRYKAASQAVRQIFQVHTDAIEPLSLDEAYLDVTENKSNLPTATLVAKMIRRQIWEQLNLTASAGVAPNKFLAKIASDWKKPNGQFKRTKCKHSCFRFQWDGFGIKTVGEYDNR
jgi:DNA polymerase-4